MNVFNIKNLKPWQRKKMLLWFVLIVLVGGTYLTLTSSLLLRDKLSDGPRWDATLATTPERQEELDKLSAGATKVTVGSYIESIKEINIKSSYFRMVAQVWFSWQGDPNLDLKNNFEVYKGLTNKIEVIKDYSDGINNYQLIRLDTSVTRNFQTKRFPLDSHQLRFYIEPNYPIQEVLFLADTQESGLNENLDVAGFKVMRFESGTIAHDYPNTFGDPQIQDHVTTSEFVAAIEVNRIDFGLYAKCFIALVGTLTWVLVTLFLSGYHKIDPLGMIPGTLFGTVTNIMVGANLLPDALQMGLLEFVNGWGILIILFATIAIINVNSSRNGYQHKEFADSYAKLMFYSIMSLTVFGHILLPCCAYLF